MLFNFYCILSHFLDLLEILAISMFLVFDSQIFQVLLGIWRFVQNYVFFSDIVWEQLKQMLVLDLLLSHLLRQMIISNFQAVPLIDDLLKFVKILHFLVQMAGQLRELLFEIALLWVQNISWVSLDGAKNFLYLKGQIFAIKPILHVFGGQFIIRHDMWNID